MPTLELGDISQPIRGEYLTLLEDLALTAGVAPENISEILKASRRSDTPQLRRGSTVRIRHVVDKEFPIDLDTGSAGRVFELAGQSDRNKTTSLIYMATLLGIDWTETRPFLDRDDKVYNVATRIVVPALSRGQKAELHLASTSYELSIVMSDGRAIISLFDENRRPVKDFNGKVVPLDSPEDWRQYRQWMELMCDVQFVGKSRDFIGQVSVEESKDLVWVCEEVSTRAGLLLSYFQNLPRDQVYGRTEQELAEEVASIRGRLAELRQEIDTLDQEMSNLRKVIQNSQDLIALRRALQDSETSDLRRAVRYLSMAEAAVDHDKRKQDLERAIDGLERDKSAITQQLEHQAPLLAGIRESLDSLGKRVLSELKNLSVLGNYAMQIPRFIAGKDYEQLLDFCAYANVTSEAVELLDSVLQIIEKYSKGIVIPLDFDTKPGIKLQDLAKQLETARQTAIDIGLLNPEMSTASQAFRTAGVTSSQDMHRLETSVETARALVKEKERALKDRTDELEVTIKTLQSLLGEEDLLSLRNQGDEVITALAQDQRDKLDQVELLAENIGYPRPWQMDPSELQAAIRDWQAKIQDLEYTRNERESAESKLRKSLLDLQRNKLRTESGRPQPDALRELQDILGYIIDYLEDYGRRYEGLQSYSEVHLQQLEQNLGANLDKVHRTLNRVIRQRCPVMYKNRASGPEKLHVQDYDFLKGEQSIPELRGGEWAGGGGDSAMTVLGLATRSSGSYVGTVLLVDEFNDAETFKKVVCNDLAQLEQLAFAVFAKQDPEVPVSTFEVIQ